MELTADEVIRRMRQLHLALMTRQEPDDRDELRDLHERWLQLLGPWTGTQEHKGELWRLRQGHHVAVCSLWNHSMPGFTEVRCDVNGQMQYMYVREHLISLIGVSNEWREQLDTKGWVPLARDKMSKTTSQQLDTLLVMRKGDRRAVCALHTHDLGWECRLFSGDELIATHVCRTDAEIETCVSTWRDALKGKGWEA
jgi:hypothetical protein